ncbi:MAG: MSMEG_0568 family radical SAM protein [Candidatus Methanolliviera hydrocarbonicum]|uniref:MSMEG_0568 family radical SAM protein n=1 Tax=Candidatus Methanolliviera hydrocarbonicum TaxID=2491085 RepID=A0A520KWC3_9EURY|nr:MAG: MSMEG_0568 family radical SAM protein [Candidatus Methanolliviera hydrocarbonicum]
MIEKMNTKDLKIDLQSNGIRVLAGNKGRKGGAGPAGSNMFIFGNTVTSAPTFAKFVSKSPYSIELEGERGILRRGDKEITKVRVPRPRFYDLKTKDGIPHKKIALLHGEDCLATTVVQRCIYWNTPERCKFCGIELSKEVTLEVKKPEELAEVAEAAKRLDGVTHTTLTTGTIRERDKGIEMLSKCASAIKDSAGISVHVQFEPPKDLACIEDLYENGVDTVGIHIESFDKEVLGYIAPAKAKIGIERYVEAWKRSVDIFGENQVSSFIIAGLGESDESIIDGSKILSDLGVYPFVLPLSPIPGTYLEDEVPPSFKRMKNIYEAVSNTIKDANLSWKKSKAGCVRCRACSALDVFEE